MLAGGERRVVTTILHALGSWISLRLSGGPGGVDGDLSRAGPCHPTIYSLGCATASVLLLRADEGSAPKRNRS